MGIENSLHKHFFLNLGHHWASIFLVKFNIGIDRKIPKKTKYVYFSHL